jgi:hypothetical protein
VKEIRGSNENKLKVFKPNEFDVDVVLTLPISDEFVRVSALEKCLSSPPCTDKIGKHFPVKFF